jgi:hypothetical protein
LPGHGAALRTSIALSVIAVGALASAPARIAPLRLDEKGMSSTRAQRQRRDGARCQRGGRLASNLPSV